MAVIINLGLGEPVSIDAERISILKRDLGSAGAECVVVRAIEEVSERLLTVESAWIAGDFCLLSRTAQSLIAIADQVGMHLLAHVACDAAALAECRDDAALAAVVARFQRVGEGSLLALWGRQEFRL